MRTREGPYCIQYNAIHAQECDALGPTVSSEKEEKDREHRTR